MYLKYLILIANFTASIFENVCVELCRDKMIDVVGWDFVLLLEVFDVLGRSDAGGVTVLSVPVLILEVQ